MSRHRAFGLASTPHADAAHAQRNPEAQFGAVAYVNKFRTDRF
jgi:hypothetical protein